MAIFDFVDCASRAYRYVWQERQQIVRISAIVVGIKALSFFAVFLMGLEGNVLRQGLLLLPASFVEGVVIAQIITMAISGQSFETLYKSHRLASPPILGSAILYVLLKLALAFVMGTSMPSPQELASPPNGAAAEPSLVMLLLSIILMGFVVWAFRLLWIYIPVALGYSVSAYTRRFRAFKDSFPLLGVWLFCFVPSGIVLLVLMSVVQGIFPLSAGVASYAHHIANSAVQAVIDYLMVLLSSLGIAFGIQDAMSGKKSA